MCIVPSNQSHLCSGEIDVDIESLRAYCLSLPNATEDIQWGNDLLFRIGGKIFAGVGLETHDSAPHQLSFKCTPEVFSELIEKDGIIPAPYTARYHWVGVQQLNALPARQMKEQLKVAY